MNANECTGLLRPVQSTKFSHRSGVWFVWVAAVFSLGAFMIYMKGGYGPSIQQAYEFPGWLTDWHEYDGAGGVDAHNYGQNFRILGETFFLDILGDEDLPRPRFAGSGSGEGQFRCGDFKGQWDGFNCFQMTLFMNNLLDLQHKRLAGYLTKLVDNPSKIHHIMKGTERLGGKQAQTINSFYEIYGGIPFDLVQDFGGGSGAGMQIMCNGTLLLTMGGGGGGGVELDAVNQTWDWQGGGGGGVQIYDPDDNTTMASLGGGSGTPNYTANVDDDANSTSFMQLWPKVKSSIRHCPRDTVHLHGGGGGGGGISVRGVESYLWKYFYFYFEYGSDADAYVDGGNNTNDTEQGEEEQQQDQQQQDQNCQNQQMSKFENDYCAHIPNKKRRDFCEKSRNQQAKHNAGQKSVQAAMRPTSADTTGDADTASDEDTSTADSSETTAAGSPADKEDSSTKSNEDSSMV